MEASEKARKVLSLDPKDVDQDLYQALAFIIDQEPNDWADASGVDDVESQIRRMSDKVNGRIDRYLVENVVNWSANELPRTSVALYCTLGTESQKHVTHQTLRKMMEGFASSAADEVDLKNAARLLRSLSKNLEKPVNGHIDVNHYSCEILASVIHKLNKIYPYIIEMDSDVKAAIAIDVPRLTEHSSEFKNYLLLERDLIRAFSSGSGKDFHVNASLMDRHNYRFDMMIAGAKDKIHLGSNALDLFRNAGALLSMANIEIDIYRHESNVRQPTKAVELVLSTLSASRKLLRQSFLRSISENPFNKPFNNVVKAFSDMHGNLIRLGCTDDQLRAPYTNVLASAVTAFSNAKFQNVLEKWQVSFLDELLPYTDFSQVDKNASAAGREYFIEYIRKFHPKRAIDLSLLSLGKAFSNDLGL